ncbi:hypothetical protein [Candidatus Soleaferrea massiliensis]|uniref:hypothetical protein n=1 Tax=Candidatus Soleaferrea massiliensis TaxID=1470354 RepID=UPI00058E3EEB|nr:hypothetical protein [Candidatus Soleaferrea massiliensis]
MEDMEVCVFIFMKAKGVKEKKLSLSISFPDKNMDIMTKRNRAYKGMTAMLLQRIGISYRYEFLKNHGSMQKGASTSADAPF